MVTQGELIEKILSIDEDNFIELRLKGKDILIMTKQFYNRMIGYTGMLAIRQANEGRNKEV